MKFALKEWDTTVEALGKGHIIAIWRKGGLQDSPNLNGSSNGFNIEQNQFVLFPTFTHQATSKIKEEFYYLFDKTSTPNKDNQIKIKYWAEFEESIDIHDLENLLKVSSELVNSKEHLINSWDLNPNLKGKLLFLRVYILSNPVLVPDSPSYSGCKSWIELNVNIPKIGSKPVLSYKDFSSKARLIKNLLESSTIKTLVETR